MDNQPKQNIIALVYDFDGTLSPQPMQEYTVLPEIGLEPSKFWDRVNAENHRTCGEPIITYMRLMYEEIEKAGAHIDKKRLKSLGRNIQYFEGVHEWFENINAYVHDKAGENITIRHYIISSGLLEILEGISIFDKFTNVFASEYYFDKNDKATYPKRVITDTNKTQYLFRINKGIENLAESINQHMPENERPVPFANMIYFGDGLTDVPSMAVTRANGGHAVAVYSSGNKKQYEICQILLKEKRCDFHAQADYKKSSALYRRTCLILDRLIAELLLKSEIGN